MFKAKELFRIKKNWIKKISKSKKVKLQKESRMANNKLLLFR